MGGERRMADTIYMMLPDANGGGMQFEEHQIPATNVTAAGVTHWEENHISDKADIMEPEQWMMNDSSELN